MRIMQEAVSSHNLILTCLQWIGVIQNHLVGVAFEVSSLSSCICQAINGHGLSCICLHTNL